MKVWIDRDLCSGQLSECLTCLTQLVATGSTEQPCIVDYEANGSKDVSIFTLSEGEAREPLVIPRELVRMIAHQFREGAFARKIEIEL